MKELTVNNIDDEISNGIVLVDFWAPWCSPCMTLSKVLEQLEEELPDQFKVCKVNIDNEPKLAMRFKVNSLPTIIIFRNGELVETMLGLQKLEKLKLSVQTYLEG